jgi:hypothetical protein
LAAISPVPASMAVMLPVIGSCCRGPPPVKNSRGLYDSPGVISSLTISLQLSITGMYQRLSSGL